MTENESLEQQAAAWVPPWARTPSPAEEEHDGAVSTESVAKEHLLAGEAPQAGEAASGGEPTEEAGLDAIAEPVFAEPVSSPVEAAPAPADESRIPVGATDTDADHDEDELVECGPDDLAGPLEAVEDEPPHPTGSWAVAGTEQSGPVELPGVGAGESPAGDEPVAAVEDEDSVDPQDMVEGAQRTASVPVTVVESMAEDQSADGVQPAGAGDETEPAADSAVADAIHADTTGDDTDAADADTAATGADHVAADIEAADIEVTDTDTTAADTDNADIAAAAADVADISAAVAEDAQGTADAHDTDAVEDGSGADEAQAAAVGDFAEALGGAGTAVRDFDVDGLDDSGEAAVLGASHLATPPPGLAEAELIPALEAIMLVVDEPVSEITLAEVLDVPAEVVAGTLIDLSASYTRQNRGFDLRRAAGGWRLYTRAEYAPYVERFVLDGQQLRLTQASLETLAVVAYKQPVTRSRISAIRGVNCDGVIRTLVTRGMIEECGTEPESGAYLYRTTSLFLEKLGLDSVEQLPPLAPFLPDNVEEIADEQR